MSRKEAPGCPGMLDFGLQMGSCRNLRVPSVLFGLPKRQIILLRNKLEFRGT
jgi:hypothetical protein